MLRNLPTCTCVHLCTCGTPTPLLPHQQGSYYSGCSDELKINETQCNERHLVKQSQLPGYQSPCNCREDKRKPGNHGGCEHMIAPSRSGRGREMELRTEVGHGGGLLSREEPFLFQEGTARGTVSNKDNRVRWGRVLCNPCPGPSGAANFALPESWKKTCFSRWGPVSWERPGPAPETPLLAGEIRSPVLQSLLEGLMTRSWKWPGLLGGGRPHVHPLESKPWEWNRPSTPPRLTESPSSEFPHPLLAGLCPASPRL